MTHLWEADHPYYCNDGNYYSNECFKQWRSFDEYLAEFADADLDMNLVFRWDWREGADWGAGEFRGGENYRNGLLKLYHMGQRKGLFNAHEIQVCRSDEPRVIEYLKPYVEILRAMWAPLI